MNPRVTIGLPFYNSEGTFELALRSIFSQSFDDWELLLIDDGSTDGSLEMAYSVDDPRLRVISDGINRGVAYRLNQIARSARGEYLARMDADDIMLPQRLERQVQFLDEHPTIDLVGTAVFVIDTGNNPVAKRGFRVVGNPSPFHVLRRGTFIHPTVTGRTAWFRDNPYDTRFSGAEDRELWCRTYTFSHFAHRPEPLLFYREDGCFNVRKYRRYSKAARRVFHKYATKQVGVRGYVYLLAESYLKVLAYSLASLLGLEESIVRRRSAPLTRKELHYALAAMQQVQKCSLPRIDR